MYAHYQNNDAPVLSEPQAILPEVEPGGSITITSDDLTQGFTDPEGDQIYISGLRTKYGDWEINEDETIGTLPMVSQYLTAECMR